MNDSVVERAKKMMLKEWEETPLQGFAASGWDDLDPSVQQAWIRIAEKEMARTYTDPTSSPSLASDILNQARAIVSGSRQTVNGKPERSFAQLAQMWSAYLGAPVTDVDCAQMLALLKMVRAKSGVTKGDHFVDQAGYSALAGELAANGTP